MFSFGTDPEFFLTKNNHIISAINILKEDPDQRRKIDNFHFYHDNVLAEFSTEPMYSKEETISSLNKAMTILKKIISPCNISFVPYYEFEPRYLRSFEAKLAACNPDWCAYQIEMKRPIDTEPYKGKWVFTTNARTAGGHIHIGCDQLKNEIEICAIVRLLDLFVGIPSILFDHSNESKKRRRIYGQPGRFRVKSYGLEYRTLSNWWLQKDDYIGLMYDLCNMAIQIWFERGKDFLEIDYEAVAQRNNKKAFKVKYNQSEIIDAIKSADVVSAERIVNTYSDYYPQSLLKDMQLLKSA